MSDHRLQDAFERGLTGGRLPPPKVSPTKLPTPLGRAAWFLLGLGFVSVCAWPLSQITGRGYLASLAVLLGTMALVVTTVLSMLVRWARSKDERMRQFSLGSLLLLMLVLAALLGMLRWFAEGDWTSFSRHANPPGLGARWLVLGLGLAFVGPIGLLFALRMADALLWLGVWMLRRGGQPARPPKMSGPADAIRREGAE
ncbi:MAG: hypothetical protein AB7O62_10530 [Pirellulales bacterium]